MNKEKWEERYNKTKFAKSGGACFECCEYEKMDTELRGFIQWEIEQALQQERERIIEELESRIETPMFAETADLTEAKIRRDAKNELIEDIIKTLKQ